MSDRKEDESRDDRMYEKVFEICEAAVSRVHETMQSPDKVPLSQLKDMILLTREAWSLANSRMLELTPEEIDKLTSIAQGEDVESDEQSYDEDDDEGLYGEDHPFGG